MANSPVIPSETDNDPIDGDGDDDLGGYVPPVFELPPNENVPGADAGTGETPSEPGAGTADAGSTDPLGDLGGLLGDLLGGGGGTTPPPASGNPPAGPGVCEGKTPHGCYSLAPNAPAGCPAQIPEIPTLIPGLGEWDFCSGGAVGAGVTCSYNGPLGASGSCICDLQTHWICIYL